MSQPYIGEIRMFAGSFPPAGWMFCEGQYLAIPENEALFQLIGTTYGGDGEQTFGLPDLRGRIPIHQGAGFVLAENGGAEQVAVRVNQLPSHNHPLFATTNRATGTAPAGSVAAASTGATVSPYGNDNPRTTLAPQSMSPVGGDRPHNNMQPYLCVNFIISLFGIFPTPS